MNTTKFRGQILDGPRKGEWVYGNLIQTPTRTYILEAEYEVDFIEPEYHEQGMGCGLEDRNITDRYEAMFHGFERALDKCAENHPPFIEVDPKTVGQYIGLEDKNHNEIYQGDIIRITRDKENYGSTCYGGHAEVASEVCGYSFKCFNPSLKDIEENPLDEDGDYRAWDSTSLWHIDDDNGKNIEVIGSIHNNPDLLTQQGE